MTVTTLSDTNLEQIREIVLDVLELEDDELTLTSSFQDEHDADSLRAIEILARIEKQLGVEIPQSDLPKMENLQAVNAVVAQHTSSDA